MRLNCDFVDASTAATRWATFHIETANRDRAVEPIGRSLPLAGTATEEQVTRPEGDDGREVVIPWAERDANLEFKLRKLYETNLDSWIAMQGDRKFEQKWHVGRAMLDWFYKNHMLDADEFEAVNVKYSRPSKPGYDIEMYRIVWIKSGRASDQVAAISLAPRTGPSKGYLRGSAPTPSERLEAETDDRPRPSMEARLAAGSLKADREIVFGGEGWVYCYAYEEALQHCDLLGKEPLIKVGHTSGHYVQRIAAQVRGTEVPDVPRILRAYQVVDSGGFEAAVHRRLKAEGRHHRRAGGAEWFRVTIERLDEIVQDVAGSSTGGR